MGWICPLGPAKQTPWARLGIPAAGLAHAQQFPHCTHCPGPPSTSSGRHATGQAAWAQGRAGHQASRTDPKDRQGGNPKLPKPLLQTQRVLPGCLSPHGVPAPPMTQGPPPRLRLTCGAEASCAGRWKQHCLPAAAGLSGCGRGSPASSLQCSCHALQSPTAPPGHPLLAGGGRGVQGGHRPLRSLQPQGK